MRNLVLAGIFLLSLSQHAYALFGDDEARKQIQELQKKTDSQNQATQETIKKNQQALEQRIAALEAAIKGQGMLDLLNQIDRLNQELSNVKGQLEIANHNIDSAQQRQKDLYTDVDGRIRKLESGAPATSSADVPVANSTAVAAIENAGEVKDFEAALAFSRSGKHKEAFEAFGKFLQTYPTSTRAPDAQYALGYAQFSLKNYNAAIATQQKLLKQFPDSPKAPDAAFNIANSQIQLADIDGAKKTLRDLVAKYPASEVAPKAKSRLTVLDSIKK